MIPRSAIKVAVALAFGFGAASAAWSEPQPPASQQQARNAQKSSTNARAPKRQVGKASFYGKQFYGRKMANGKPMHPEDDNAASRTLPLGTVARVTNLENGQSTVVTIEDRGPYVDGRIVDLSPGSAREIGLTPRQGLAPVEVVPIRVPEPDES